MTTTKKNLHEFSVDELTDAYGDKRVSPVEATEAALARVDAHNEAVNAFVVFDPETARDMARDSESRWTAGAPLGPHDGVPTTLKDTMYAKGWPTLRGSRTSDTEGPWDVDAPPVARLREAGAVFLGKTTTPEFGWKGITDSDLSGITRNPWNTGRTTGGSSGGAVAAAALGMGVLHTGSDAGGSVRIPASFTGVFALKPTYGRVPVWPASAFGTLSHIGPITRTVSDAAIMLNVMAQPDARDWTSLPQDGTDYLDGLDGGIEGLRVAFSPTLGFADNVDPEIAGLVRAAADAVEALGATVEEVDPDIAEAPEVFRTHWETYAALLLAQIPESRHALIEEGFMEVAAAGASVTATDYLAAAMARNAIGETMQAFFETYDLLLTPGQPLPAFTAGIEFPEGMGMSRWYEWTPFTYPFNLTQQPAASVPCGFTKAGLPAALQIVGPLYADALVLRAARAYETAYPFKMPDAPISGA